MSLGTKKQKGDIARKESVRKSNKRSLEESADLNEKMIQSGVEGMDTTASGSNLQNNFSNVFKPCKSSNSENNKKTLVIKRYKESKEKDDYNQRKDKQDLTKALKEWNEISKNIEAILTDTTTGTTLEKIFNLVQTVCDSNNPKRLYDRLIEMIYNYSINLRKTLDTDSDIPLDEDNCEIYLERFAKIWKVFPLKISLIRNIFLYLDRIILSKNIDNDMLPIWEATMRVFRRVFFPEIENEFKSIKLFMAIFIELQRLIKNSDVEGSSIRELLSMISTVHANDEFMEYFLIQIRDYYNQKRLELMPDMSCNEYMKYSFQQIEQYTEIVNRHFCESTASQIIFQTILECLVTSALPEILLHGFDALLESEDIKDVKCMFSLCRRCPGGEDCVRVEFTKYIRAKGQKLMSSCQDDDLFQEVLIFKKKMDLIVIEGFENSMDLTKFKQALSDSFEFFINSSNNRAAELIAKYFHGLLRMCHKKATDESLDQMIDDAIVVFRFLRGKDVFEAFYKRDLAKRLLLDRSASVDAEKAVLAKLKTECGAGFTHKLEGMFKDMEISEDFNRLFYQYLEHEKKTKTNINVRILTRDHWPSYDLYEINLPKEMRGSLIDFCEFYKLQHGNRNVQWHHGLSTGVVSAKFRPGCYKELLVNVYHAVILLLFNESCRWTVTEIVNATKINHSEVIRTVLSLLGGRGKPQVLIMENNQKLLNSEEKKGGETITEKVEQAVLMVNTELKEKLYRIRIAQVQMKTTKEEKEKVEQEVSQDRQYQIDAAAVRIMKARKELTHSQLVQEIMAQLKFPVKGVDIKTRIGSLIEREYIQRDADEPNKYKYVA